MPDAVIIGGGAIGLASAWELAKRGLAVTVLERDPGATLAASRAAAGMLSAQLEAHPSEAMASLCMQGRERHASFLAELATASGLDLDARLTGALRVAFDRDEAESLARLVAEQHARGWEAELVSADEAQALVPGLARVRSGAFFAGERVADPPRIMDALVRACASARITLREGAEVARIDGGNGGTHEVVLTNGERLACARVVIAGGAWSAAIDGTGIEGKVRPIRGQMLELRHADIPARIVEGPGAYLSPRSDGRVLVGSTLEDVGFDRAITAEAATSLREGAERLLPRLGDATRTRHWCGFRSATRDRIPLLGVTSTGVVAATGHYRNGIVLTAITADIVAALVMDAAPPVPLAPFDPNRPVKRA